MPPESLGPNIRRNLGGSVAGCTTNLEQALGCLQYLDRAQATALAHPDLTSAVGMALTRTLPRAVTLPEPDPLDMLLPHLSTP